MEIVTNHKRIHTAKISVCIFTLSVNETEKKGDYAVMLNYAGEYCGYD